jgi:hypothetical protein
MMRVYALISCALFALVAFFHLLRVVNGWALLAGSWSIPMWVSWGGFVFPGLLCAWAFRLAAKR